MREVFVEERTEGEARPRLVGLDDVAARDASLTGGKASALARARRAGFDVPDGVVLTTGLAADVDGGADLASHEAVVEAHRRLGSDAPLIARSSSVVEDQATSSAAGQFESVGGITTLDGLVAGVRTVLASRARAAVRDAPIAVLVQPVVDVEIGGVLFGVDPVSGRSDRTVVTAVLGAVDSLVSGEHDGSRFVVDDGGRVVERHVVDGASLSRSRLRRLTALADRLDDLFGGPQDVEWAIDAADRLWVLQSRPVTTEVRGVPSGPILGPGPVAETFPEALHPLEVDLWVPPLREAIGHALVLAGAAKPDRIAASPVVTVVNGFVALDLELTGEDDVERSTWSKLNPVTKARALRSAWRVGRLRSALPRLADELIDRTDADLEGLPPLEALSDRQLVGVLGRGRVALRSLHGHEVLMGLLTDAASARMTGASVAMRVLAEARTEGADDAEILTNSPIVLALTPPRVGPVAALPPSSETPDLPPPVDGDASDPPTDAGVLREALRLRVRWVQELMARTAWVLACRLVETGQLERREQVRFLDLDDLVAVATKRAVIVHSPSEELAANHGTPLPARFQLSDRGRPVPVHGSSTGGGTGAGGGVGRGPVTFDAEHPPRGSVLVVTTLQPGLGPLLGRLSGIVSETGSVLAHLAILAREAGVPTVVGHAGATRELEEGTIVEVDGEAGTVEVVDEGVDR